MSIQSVNVTYDIYETDFYTWGEQWNLERFIEKNLDHAISFVMMSSFVHWFKDRRNDERTPVPTPPVHSII